jgi:restriction endonuclease S subunit
MFVPGINPSRVESQYGTNEIQYYDQAAFENDFNYGNDSVVEKLTLSPYSELALNEGDVVISNSMQLATIVGKCNIGKVPSLNFTKAEFISSELDRYYFLYLLNTYQGVKRQKEKGLQGSGAVLRLPLKTLNQIIIPVPPMTQQKKIGMIYTETLRLQNKLNKYGALIEHFTSSIIEDVLEGGVSK